MSIAFLRALSRQQLPTTLTAPEDVDQLMVLRAAGMVVALTLRPLPEEGRAEIARCLAITPEGHAALRQGCCAADASPVRPSPPAFGHVDECRSDPSSASGCCTKCP